MSLVYNDLRALKAIENKFINEIKENNIKLLRNLLITEEKYEETRSILRKVAARKALDHYASNYPVSISVFLVFCGVIHYKEGDFWEQVFSELEIKYSNKRRGILGEVFLSVIKEYDLLSLDKDIGHKYVSPILMHGYISNSYTPGFFDRMNSIYEGILDCNVSKYNISSNWDEMFRDVKDEDDQVKSNDKIRIDELNASITILLEELDQFTVPTQLQNLNKIELNLLIKDTELIEIENDLDIIKRDQLNDESSVIIEKRNEIDTIIALETRIKSDTSIIEAKELLDYIEITFGEVRKRIDNKYTNVITRHRELTLNINKDRNRVTINKAKIRDIQTKVSILGSGNLDIGWDILSDYNTIKKDIQEKENKLRKLEKKLKLRDDSLNTSFIQIYTTALYNLRLSSQETFNFFIISTLKMMDRYFRYNNINDEHILSSELIKWYNSPEVKERRKLKKSSTLGGDSIVVQSENKNKEETNGNIKMTNIKAPYFKFEVSSGNLKLILPEQILKVGFRPDNNPEYIIRYDDNKEKLIESSTKSDHESMLIHEICLEIDIIDIKNLMFKWFNRRELFNLELNPVTIFNSKGLMLSETLINNGVYYILCHGSWELREGYVIDEFHSSIKGYKVYEVLLEESSISFINKSTSETIQFISSRYNHIHIEDLSVIDGITIDKYEILQFLPKVKYNNRLINDKEMYISISINNEIHLNQKMYEIAEMDNINENIKIIDLNLLSLNQTKYPILIRVSITKESGDEIFLKEYYWIKETKLTFGEDELFINIPNNSKLDHPRSKIDGDRYIIPLEVSPIEEIKIWYSGLGWLSFVVDVPTISMRVIDENGNEVEICKDILKDQLLMMKDYNINFEVTGKTMKFVQMDNLDGNLDLTLPLRNNSVDLKIDLIIDLLLLNEDKDTLFYKLTGKGRKSKRIEMCNIYKSLIVSDMEVFQEELEDEFVLEVTFNYNFNYNGDKRIRMINGDNTVFDKSIEEDNPYYYIKKNSLVNENVSIEIYHKDEHSKSLFSRNKDNVVGRLNLALKSSSLEIKSIVNNGLIISDFKYNKESLKLLYPFTIYNIKEGQALNFIGEKIYNGLVNINGRIEKVIFYIDIENKELPLLLDKDRDGAQYDLRTGEVFWDVRNNQKVLGPIEYFKYKIKEAD